MRNENVIQISDEFAKMIMFRSFSVTVLVVSPDMAMR